VETFLRSKINWKKRKEGKNKVLLDFYKRLIELRKKIPALSELNKDNLDVWGLEEEKIMFMRRRKNENESHVFSVFNFNKSDMSFRTYLPEARWKKILDSSEKLWNGPGILLPDEMNSGDELTIRGLSMALYEREEI
jgi:maltooligosyltrehalose trehalohydrolase